MNSISEDTVFECKDGCDAHRGKPEEVAEGEVDKKDTPSPQPPNSTSASNNNPDNDKETTRPGLADFIGKKESNKSRNNIRLGDNRNQKVQEIVECHECGYEVIESDAVEKYRINDGETVPYCNDSG